MPVKEEDVRASWQVADLGDGYGKWWVTGIMIG